ncbi:MAG: RNA polymerase sigma factor [Clostridia bacterium]
MILCLTSVTEFNSPSNNFDLDNLISKIAHQDEQALAKLYEKTSKSVYSFALSILKNTHDAQDVMHDCYVKIFNSAPSYVSAKKPMAWIITITKNLCLMKIRDNKKKSRVPQEDWANYVMNKPQIPQDDKILISYYMKKLSDEERQIVILHAVSGFSHKQIGEVLEIKHQTVISKYNRALKKLNALMSEEV